MKDETIGEISSALGYQLQRAKLAANDPQRDYDPVLGLEHAILHISRAIKYEQGKWFDQTSFEMESGIVVRK